MFKFARVQKDFLQTTKYTNHMIKKIILSLLAPALFVIFLSQPIHAQTSVERIQSFDTVVNIDKSGAATITETILYDFGSSERRGIFRDIPVQSVVSGDQGYQLKSAVLSITRDGKTEPYVLLSESSAYSRVRIGNADVTIGGLHTYVIQYTLEPIAVATDDNFEIVRIDAPGTGWSVPVESVSVEIKTDQTQPTLQTCYEGSQGSTSQTCTFASNAFSASRTLSAGESITAEAVYQPGTFSSLAEITTLETNTDNPVVGFIIFGAIGVFGTVFGSINALGRIRHRKRIKQELAYARYEAPKNMGPAEIGLLIDNSSDGAELSATLLNFAVTGHMKIIQTKEKKWYRKAEYSFQKLKSPGSTLKAYEISLFNELFKGKEKVSTKDLSTSTSFAKENSKFHKTLKSNLQTLGFYKKVSVFSPTLASRMTKEGYKKWAEIEGFREFLKVTQTDRLAFSDAPERKPEQFSEFLPHAIAFGVEKQWAKQFEDLNIDVSDWYQGSSNTALTTAYLASSLGRGLGSVAASANKSSGSSGSGGGFSGGGFGGGGGGSW